MMKGRISGQREVVSAALDWSKTRGHWYQATSARASAQTWNQGSKVNLALPFLTCPPSSSTMASICLNETHAQTYRNCNTGHGNHNRNVVSTRHSHRTYWYASSLFQLLSSYAFPRGSVVGLTLLYRCTFPHPRSWSRRPIRTPCKFSRNGWPGESTQGSRSYCQDDSRGKNSR